MKHISVVLFLIFCSLCGGQTIINGGSVSGSWTAAQSPYHVLGNCVIPADETLTIQPGTQVLFAADVRLQVSGSLKAEGTVADSIIFSALNPEQGWNGIRCYSTATTQQDSTIFTYCRLSNAKAEEGYWNCRGGALLLHNSGNQRIENCVFEHNTAEYGGAAYLYGSPAIIRHCSFRYNEASHDGGAIQISSGSHALVKGCLFEYNHCMYDGGGLFIAGDTQATVEECTIRYNGAMDMWDYSASGGGISVWGATATISNCTITNNTSEGVAGGVLLCNDATATLENSLIENNWANDSGGIYVYQSDATLLGVIIRYNSCQGFGGGLEVGYQSTVITDPQNPCDIYLNNAYHYENVGNDLNCNYGNSITLHLGIFTMLQPTEALVYPLDNFTLDIQQGYCAPAAADLFVSPDGLPFNSGLSADEPIQSLFQAITMIQCSAATPRTIHLAAGTYSSATTGEVYPLELKTGLTLSGSGMNNSILDADSAAYCLMAYEATDAEVHNCAITGASACGFWVKGSQLMCSQMRLYNNRSKYNYAAGMHLQNDCDVALTDCRIDANEPQDAEMWQYGLVGGGIGCWSSTLSLAGTTICNNVVEDVGGGLYADNNSTVVWDADNRCSVYDNHTQNVLYGNDLYYGTTSAVMDVIVDTFTVLTPQQRHAYPLDRFSFDIQHCSVPQIAADLYVSPSGNDANSGLSASEPLRTIAAASQRILGTAAEPHTIHLAEGTYSPSSSGELFPVLMGDYITLAGTASAECRLDAQQLSSVLILGGTASGCEDVTITHGNTLQYNDNGSGIRVIGDDVTIKNTVITQCYSAGSGGGVAVQDASGTLDGVQIVHCAASGAGGLYVEESQITLKNCSIRDNTSEQTTGGMFIYQNCSVTFDPEARSSIYNNHTHGDSWASNDLGSGNAGTIAVVVDTFTVMQPDGMTAAPTGSFSFDIQQGYVAQHAADIYVSPDGAVNNSGLSPDEPLPSLNLGLLACQSTATDPHTIHLLPGVYRDAEYFPYSLLKPITITGTSAQEVVLDASGFKLFLSDSVDDITLSNITMCNANGGSSCLEFHGSDVCIEECIFHDMRADYGGVVSVTWQSYLQMDRCLFYNNTSQYAANALLLDNADGTITNCTFVQCGTEYHAPVRLEDATAFILNSIFWNNNDTAIYYHGDTSDVLVIDHSLLQGGEDAIMQYGSAPLYYQDCNIDADPLFVDGSSDFHLTEQSPCIDSGTAGYTWQNQQILAIPDSLYNGLAPDMGCFEYDGTAAGGSVVPAVSRLLGNYPNPFKPAVAGRGPTTEIRFQISDASQLEHTQIEIFNVKGQKVKQLKADVSSRAKSRDLTFSITWDGTDSTNKPVASGVYLYQLKVGDKTIDQRKMMLLK
jgi:hypothetical protein